MPAAQYKMTINFGSGDEGKKRLDSASKRATDKGLVNGKGEPIISAYVQDLIDRDAKRSGRN